MCGTSENNSGSVNKAGPVTNNEDYFGGKMTELSEEKM